MLANERLELLGHPRDAARQSGWILVCEFNGSVSSGESKHVRLGAAGSCWRFGGSSVRMAAENPTWGYTRLHGALQNVDNRLVAGTRMIDLTGRVRRCPRLGGVLNFHERAA